MTFQGFKAHHSWPSFNDAIIIWKEKECFTVNKKGTLQNIVPAGQLSHKFSADNKFLKFYLIIKMFGGRHGLPRRFFIYEEAENFYLSQEDYVN
jgi:hypothetical protein